MIEILSGVSLFTGEGFVTLRWGAESGQLTPAEARTHALHLLEVAEAAECDAIVLAELTDPAGLALEQQTAATFLVSLRKRRDPR